MVPLNGDYWISLRCDYGYLTFDMNLQIEIFPSLWSNHLCALKVKILTKVSCAGIEPQRKVVAHGLLAIKNKVSVLKKLDALAYE
jgi:hypothetical protein